MRKKLIEIIGKMTVSDFKDMNEFQKAHELLILLKGEPRKRARKSNKTVTAPAAVSKSVVTEEVFS
jgi:hypothetical protein